jgi:hypothetical protein
MGLASDYSKAVWEEKHLMATYPPKDTLRLGDVVEFNEGRAVIQTSLDDLKIPFHHRDGDVQPSWIAESKTGVSIVEKLKGSIPDGVSLMSDGRRVPPSTPGSSSGGPMSAVGALPSSAGDGRGGTTACSPQGGLAGSRS